MIVKCDSDATAFILHCTFTTVFCLRRECHSLKSGFLLVLALSDWMAVLCRTFAGLILENNWCLASACMCEQPQVLLQTGVLILNLVVLEINTELSERSHPTKRQTYLHLFLFNALSFALARTAIHSIARVLDDAGNELAAEHVLGITFLTSIYRTTFLSLDCLYYVYFEPDEDKRHSIVGVSRLTDKAIIVQI